MKKLLLSSLILSSFSGLVYAEEAAFKPTDKELEVIKVMLKEDIQKFLNGEETPSNEEYKENEKLNALKPIEAETILKTYSENELRGDKYYKGKSFLVSGTIKTIDNGINDDAFLIFLPKDKFSFQSVQARFKKTEYEKLVEVNKGEKIEVFCTGSGEINGSPMLTECSFFDKNEAVDAVVKSYVDELEKLKAGNVSETSQVMRKLSFTSSVFSKATNEFSLCKDKIEIKCIEKAISKAPKAEIDKVSQELSPLREFLQVSEK